MPFQSNNVQNVTSFDGNALQVNSANPSKLRYRDVESNGLANINLRCGSIRFWFKPSWGSTNAGGTGPGAVAYLIDVGQCVGSPPYPGWWGLWINSQGTNLVFSAQKGDYANHFVTNAISWTANTWHQITLSYNPWASSISVDWSTANNATNVNFTYYPDQAVIKADGFGLGSNRNGDLQAKGIIDELETFNYRLGTVEDGTKESSYDMSATACQQPPAIDLRWKKDAATAYTLERRLVSATNWTTIASNITALSYLDTNISLGQRYEYRAGGKYLEAGVNLPPVENRGRVILLIATNIASGLSANLDVLKEDLVGDGWQVVSHIVPQHDDTTWSNNTNNINWIKSLVVSNYNAAPTQTNVVFIIGHVSIPYSGSIGPDGHRTNALPPDHQGAWPSDGYYTEVDGNWTDSTINYINIHDEPQSNLPADGKYDQNYFPTNQFGIASVELAVGRIDFSRLPAFANGSPPKSELDLLRQYFEKNHRYRHGQILLPSRTIAAAYYSTNIQFENETIYQNARKNSSRLFGSEPCTILQGDIFRAKKACFWGMQGGYGGAAGDRINGGTALEYSTYELVDSNNEPPVGFYLLKGSYFGDLNHTNNNFLRAVLATPNYGLASVWTRFDEWKLSTMALGETLGGCFLRTVNTENQRNRYLALMGDPTLRLAILPPPVNLLADTNTPGQVALTWTPSIELDAQYHVYRAPGIDGAFTNRLTTLPTGANTFTDTSPPLGSKVYQVRAIKLLNTGSGSYTNISQGIFKTVN